jgi:hypothetical protein
MIVVAGGAKTLASPRNDFEREFILEQVRMSVRHEVGVSHDTPIARRMAAWRLLVMTGSEKWSITGMNCNALQN